MRKIVLLALLLTGLLPAYSQTSVGVIGGYNLATYHPRNYYQYLSEPYSYRSAWRAGVIADHHLWKKFYLQPQLLLNSKGMQSDASHSENPPQELSTGTRLLYLELQANMIFKEQLGKGKFIIGAGPYLGRGIRARNTVKGYTEIDGERSYFNTKNVIKFRNIEPVNGGPQYLKPYDAGINFQMGYECRNGLFFNAVYSLGLTNVEYNLAGYRPKNTYFGLSVGYFFKTFN